MRRSIWLIIIPLIAVALIVVGLAVGNRHTNNASPHYSTSPAASNSVSYVNIKNNMFTPAQITITRGTKVIWTNNDTDNHTVVSDKGEFPPSGTIQPGQTYSYTFNNTGSYQYHDALHTSMHSTVVVR